MRYSFQKILLVALTFLASSNRLLASDPKIMAEKLVRAADKNRIEVAEKLIAKGADVNGQNELRETPLEKAVLSSDSTMIKLLLEHGADPTKKNKYGDSPLHGAAGRGFIEAIKLLIKHGAKVNELGYHDKTVLHCAVTETNILTVDLLLKHKADVNAKDKNGVTPLHCTISYNNTKIAKLLIENGAKIDEKDNFGKTSFDSAFERLHDKIADLYYYKTISIGSPQWSKDRVEQIALLNQRSYTEEKIYEDLLTFWSNKQYESLRLNECLEFFDQMRYLQFLSKQGAQLSLHQSEQVPAITAFLLAATTAFNAKAALAQNTPPISPLVKTFIKAGASINPEDEKCYRNQHYADYNRKLGQKVVTLLLEKGNTPLHYAASDKIRGVEIVTLLLSHSRKKSNPEAVTIISD